MPEETSPQIRNRRAAKALAETATLPPQTVVEVRRGVTVRRTKGGIPVWRFHYSCHPERDPELHPEWVREERRTYTSQADWDREQEIVDEAGGGELVFAETLMRYWDKIVIEDPRWRPDLDWTVEGGFDHGKTNPTALLRAYIDFNGTIYFAGEYYWPGREIWQHAPQMRRMHDFRRMKTIFADPSIFTFTSQQSQKPGQAAERAKSYSQLYCEQGIGNLCPFAGDHFDVSFVARLNAHWGDLGGREPTVRIVCPRDMYAEKPVPGLYDWGCPNLLWELMRTRRQKLSAQQLQRRNVSEAIVDKDNHARDAMKYLLMSCPEPSRKSLDRRVAERIQAVMEVARQEGVSDDAAITQAMLQYTKIAHEEMEEGNPNEYYGGNARRYLAMLQNRILREWTR